MTDPSRTVRWWQRPAMPLASSRLGGWFFVRVAPAIDRLLMRLSRGRLSLTVGFPTLILTTTGAKTGLPRSTPLIFLPQGEQLLIVASNGGSAQLAIQPGAGRPDAPSAAGESAAHRRR